MHNSKLLSYYGKPAKLKKNGVAKILVTRQFDDGSTLLLSDPGGMFEEYDIAGRGAEFDSSYSIQRSDGFYNFFEYDIISKESSSSYYNPASKDLDFENEGYIESFQRSVTPVPRQHTAPSALPVPTEPGMQTICKQKESAASKPKNAEKSAKDEEFMADLKSILGGQKVYDPISKRMVNKADLVEQKSQVQQIARPPEKEEKELKPLAQKNEHEIFDKIAQSMRYANAYDLGSVKLEKRFNDFDALMDLKEKDKKKEKIVKPDSNKTNFNRQPELSPAPASSQDFIEDLNSIVKERQSTAQSSSIPLDPGVGGRSIGMDALQQGDIIISTTNDSDSKLIRFVTGSEISHASVYVGNGMVIEAVPDGVLERSLETSLMDDTVAVAYRHVNMTPENAQRVTDFLRKARESKAKFDYWSLVRVAPYQIINNFCSSLPADAQERCRQQARNFRTGTDMNNEFYCSELVFKALKAAGLSISDVEPSWSSPQDVVRLNHNGTLLYVGHLKA